MLISFSDWLTIYEKKIRDMWLVKLIWSFQTGDNISLAWFSFTVAETKKTSIYSDHPSYHFLISNLLNTAPSYGHEFTLSLENEWVVESSWTLTYEEEKGETWYVGEHATMIFRSACYFFVINKSNKTIF